MLTETELEDLTNSFLDDMIKLKGVDSYGRKAEQVEKLGIMAECVSTDCVPCKDICEN